MARVCFDAVGFHELRALIGRRGDMLGHYPGGVSRRAAANGHPVIEPFDLWASSSGMPA